MPLAGLLGLFGLQALLQFGNSFLLRSASDRIVADLKVRLYEPCAEKILIDGTDTAGVSLRWREPCSRIRRS